MPLIVANPKDAYRPTADPAIVLPPSGARAVKPTIAIINVWESGASLHPATAQGPAAAPAEPAVELPPPAGADIVPPDTPNSQTVALAVGALSALLQRVEGKPEAEVNRIFEEVRQILAELDPQILTSVQSCLDSLFWQVPEILPNDAG
mmetsp:Transcript_41445/g.101992  ORF Transcript_41445/g.101992 Transcript_41445/m.101992 type:complete len:149 (-) Transcript_41445:128-574(-)